MLRRRWRRSPRTPSLPAPGPPPAARDKRGPPGAGGSGGTRAPLYSECSGLFPEHSRWEHRTATRPAPSESPTSDGSFPFRMVLITDAHSASGS
ncbi:hypothetical protein NL676_028116 [Syzygium grande]|nr:hypothetical protein NL676_028116 [Syzygium grande]